MDKPRTPLYLQRRMSWFAVGDEMPRCGFVPPACVKTTRDHVINSYLIIWNVVGSTNDRSNRSCRLSSIYEHFRKAWAWLFDFQTAAHLFIINAATTEEAAQDVCRFRSQGWDSSAGKVSGMYFCYTSWLDCVCLLFCQNWGAGIGKD